MKSFTLKLLAHKIFTLIRTISSRLSHSLLSSRWAHINTCVCAALSRSLTLFVLCSCSLRMCVIVCVCIVYIYKWMVKFRFCVLWRYRCRHWMIGRKYSRTFTHTLTTIKCLLLLSISFIHMYADLSPEIAFCYLTDKIIQKFSLRERNTDWREIIHTQLMYAYIATIFVHRYIMCCSKASKVG